jgi:DNA-directed RNA polymerase III subunit RPC6
MDSAQGIFTELERHILSILNEFPSGIEDEMLSKKLKNVRDLDKAEALNRLLQKSRLSVIQTDNGIMYKYIDEEEAMRLKELLPDEYLIYQLIEEAGNKGLWINDIKKKVGKKSSDTNSIIKKLDKKGFIKSVKSIKAKNRRVWMIISVEPSLEVTGGVLADDVFDLGLMELISQKCVDFIKVQGRTDRNQVSVFIRSLSLSQMDLTDEDVYRILETQVYDGKIEVVEDNLRADYAPGESGSMLPNKTYKLANWYTPRVVYTEIPCAHCQLFGQ